jgi:hypothetical protein
MICAVCSKDQTDRVCRRCKKSMSSQLKDIRSAHHDAGFYLVPERRGERSSERGLGVRLDALDFVANFDVLPVLEEWERDWRRFFELSSYGEASSLRIREALNTADPVHVQEIELASCVRFLEDWLDKACESYEPIDEFALELRALWRKAQTAAGRTPRTSWRVTCPTDTDDGECGTVLRISGEDFDKPLHCKSCGTSWKVERLLMVVASSKHAEVWLDPEAAATWFGLPVRELRRLAQRGLIRREHGRYESHSIREAILSGGPS